MQADVEVASAGVTTVKAARRSYLIQLALLCVAVVFSGTARAVVSVDAMHHCAERCVTKVAAETPSSQKKFFVKTKKTVRRVRYASRRVSAFGGGHQIRSSRTALLFVSQSAGRNGIFGQAPAIATPSRLFVLRI